MPEQKGDHFLLGIVLTTLSNFKVGGCVILTRLDISGFIFNQSEWIVDNNGQLWIFFTTGYCIFEYSNKIQNLLMGIYSTS